MYEASEDSFLLSKYVRRFAKGKILDVGCGSGVLMEDALRNSDSVVGVDIDKEALEYCREKGFNVKYSDLFSNIKGKFDFIVFNPPYLPEDGHFLKRNFHERKNLDVIGGKKGWELIERFFKDIMGYLKKDGKILIVFSNLTNKKKVDEVIKKNGFRFKLLEEKGVGLMERLYVYLCYRFCK